jgi:hypothetical protein
MRAPVIVVTDPGFQDKAQMGFAQWDQPVQALPLNRLIELASEDAVAIMNQESVPVAVPNTSRSCCNVQAALG